ncbi:hypothetical protein [Larkinella soli]|uniref:hypothetical protein n=1 Tax=Larkinella soli TaxID=1770527 RepID=UPI000FFBD8EE|nr:hypothetical protein [Larkinella soli]
MKRRKTLFGMALLMMLGSIWACNHDNEKALRPKETSGIRTSQAEYQRLMGARTAAKGTAFEITGITRGETSLQIQVKGGCSADDYAVVWDGRIMESYPAQINLVVANEKEPGGCSMPGEFTLTVDLKKLLGETYKPADFYVRVSNGSQVQDKVADPNGAVSNQ